MYETTTVKLNRGPAKGATYTLDGPAQELVLVNIPNKTARQPWDFNEAHTYMPMYETHEYRRSLRKTKGGITIYEWMGKRA